MNNPLHEIDKIFRDGIESRSEYPPKNLWDNIESELDRKIAIKYKRNYRSLRRNASALLVFLISISSYQAAKLYLAKKSVQQSKAVVITNMADQPANYIPVTTSLDDNQFEINPQYGNAAMEHNKTLPVNKFEKMLADSDMGQTMISEEIGLKAQALQKENPEEANTVFRNAPDNGFGIKDRQNHEYARPDPLLSFSKAADDDSWKNDIAAGLKPAILGPALPGDPTNKKPIYQGEDNSRFSFSIYTSPNLAWTTLTDDRHGSVGRGNRGGGGNAGNNGGNSNGSGNNSVGGNNNGGNNNVGGNNSSANNAGNSGGNNNGGSSNGNNGGGSGGRGDNRDEIRQGEYENVAYSVGIKLGYNVSKKISLQTGVSYLVSSVSVRPKLVFASKDRDGNVSYRLNCSSGYSFLKPGNSNPGSGDSTIISDSRNTVSYLGVPVLVEYRLFSAGRFSVAASAGGQVNFLLKGKTSTTFEKGSPNESNAVSKTEGLKKAYFSAITSVTAEMQVKKNLSLTLAPTGQFGLSHMNKETSVKTRPNYLGLAAGLKLRF